MSAQVLTMRLARGADGSVRHVPTPFVPAPAKARERKKVTPPDPIRTNGETGAEQLRQYVERAERLQADINDLQADLADVMSEAKSHGFDTRGIKAIIALRKQEKHVRDENDAILETYRNALGML